MMILCPQCCLVIRISGDANEFDSLLGAHSQWYPDKYPCPNCGTKCTLQEHIEANALRILDVHDLTIAEAFAAFNGLGFPEERECGPTAVRELFKQPIEKIDLQQIRGTNRSVIHSIVFKDGTKMFLAASPMGAIIYRISKKRSIVEEVLHEG